ncbi:MAG: hypothetical protein ACPL28_02270 [bacterium]
MALPRIIRQSIESKLKIYCKKRFPARLHNEVRGGYTIRGDSVTLYEEQIGFLPPYEWQKFQLPNSVMTQKMGNGLFINPTEIRDRNSI